MGGYVLLMSWFWTVNDRVTSALTLPATSDASAVKSVGPFQTSVDDHVAVHAGLFLPFETPTSGAMKRVPSRTRSTWWTVVLSPGAACTVTSPDSVAPFAGETMFVVGGVLSVRVAAATAFAALTRPNPRLL